uniref:immunoglobulin-binding protein 1-like n=1 Tax=Callithrix jacchus TaxID=9483 RepID=UPI0023DD3B95|nr:immunoglobulin-binding protein 1-like [Callithrix jacchus]
MMKPRLYHKYKNGGSSLPKMAAEGDLLLLQLPKLLKTSKQLLEIEEVVTESAGFRIVQEKMFKDLDLLEKAAKMLSQLDLFSQNEDLEEIASTDLKYLFGASISRSPHHKISQPQQMSRSFAVGLRTLYKLLN